MGMCDLGGLRCLISAELIYCNDISIYFELSLSRDMTPVRYVSWIHSPSHCGFFLCPAGYSHLRHPNNNLYDQVIVFSLYNKKQQQHLWSAIDCSGHMYDCVDWHGLYFKQWRCMPHCLLSTNTCTTVLDHSQANSCMHVSTVLSVGHVLTLYSP